MKAPEALIQACQIPVDENGDLCITTEFLTNLQIEATRAYSDTYDSELAQVVANALELYGGVLKPEDGWAYSLDEMSGAVNICRREEVSLTTISISDENVSVHINSLHNFNYYVAFDFETREPEELKRLLILGFQRISKMCEGISI